MNFQQNNKSPNHCRFKKVISSKILVENDGNYGKRNQTEGRRGQQRSQGREKRSCFAYLGGCSRTLPVWILRHDLIRFVKNWISFHFALYFEFLFVKFVTLHMQLTRLYIMLYIIALLLLSRCEKDQNIEDKF